MSTVEKPVTMLMDEFKEKFVALLNETQLPAWVVLYLIEPYVNNLKQFDEAARAQDREDYEEALRQEAASKEVTENENSDGTCPLK